MDKVRTISRFALLSLVMAFATMLSPRKKRRLLER